MSGPLRPRRPSANRPTTRDGPQDGGRRTQRTTNSTASAADERTTDLAEDDPLLPLVDRIFVVLSVILCAVLQRTAFAPDEHFQGPEVAHRVVFGYGHLTWEWMAGLRSYAHPMLYVVLYKIAAVLGLGGSSWVTWAGPYWIHAAIALWTAHEAQKMAALVIPAYRHLLATKNFLELYNMTWFYGYCMPRPLSNSLETAFCTKALVEYMRSSVQGDQLATLQERRRSIRSWVFFGTLCVVVRPASGLFWAALAVRALIWPVRDPDSSRQSLMKERATILFIGVAVSGAVLGLATCLDWFMYGRLEVVPVNFLKFNLLDGGSALYGSSPWHANFTMHLPSILLLNFPLFWYGWWSSLHLLALSPGEQGTRLEQLERLERHEIEVTGANSDARSHNDKDKTIIHYKNNAFLGGCVFLYCLIYSIPAHKEIRFLLPVVPMCLPVIRVGVRAISLRLGAAEASGSNMTWSRWIPLHRPVHMLLNTAAFFYFSMFHQRGQVGVMSTIRDLHQTRLRNPFALDQAASMSTKVLFLTPCHSTPYYARLHTPDIRMRFFDCSPEAYRDPVYIANAEERSWLKLPDLPAGVSERAYFESDPDTVTAAALDAGTPHVVVSFKDSGDAIEKHGGYSLFKSHWNSFSGDESSILVYTMNIGS